jgi:AhpD family alkylhydroperoxidase
MRELIMERKDVSDHPAHCTSGTCDSSEDPTAENLVGIAVEIPVQSLYTDAVAELVAIGAAIAANCDPCFKYHFQQARKLGISHEDMMLAVKTAQSVKETPAKAMLQLAHQYLEGDPIGLPIVQSCCG